VVIAPKSRYNIREVKIMEYNFGDKIKSLRRAKELTQEQLAEVLGVSYQAISKWETNAALPDVTLFPILARFFGVTTDELHGMDEFRDRERIEEAYNRTFIKPEPPDAEDVALWRGLAREFPNNLKVRQHLAQVLLHYAQFEGKNEFRDEGLVIMEKVAANADGDERVNTIQQLCSQYAMAGEKQKALEWANKMTGAWFCREAVTENVLGLLRDPEVMPKMRDNIILYGMMLGNAIGQMDGFATNIFKDFLSAEQIIGLIKMRMKLEEIRWLLYPENAHGDGDWGLAFNYSHLAELYARQGDTDAVLDCAEKIAETALNATAALGTFNGNTQTQLNGDGSRTVTKHEDFTPRDLALGWLGGVRVFQRRARYAAVHGRVCGAARHIMTKKSPAERPIAIRK
jgi:transcriptional regulator with XRE-family HTH domain